MSSPGQSNKALLIRLVVLVVIGGGLVLFLKLRGTPFALSEQDARRMIESHELVGLGLDEACKRLQHRSSGTTDGMVELDFEDWSGGGIVLDVREGKVIGASWKRDVEPGDS